MGITVGLEAPSRQNRAAPTNGETRPCPAVRRLGESSSKPVAERRGPVRDSATGFEAGGSGPVAPPPMRRCDPGPSREGRLGHRGKSATKGPFGASEEVD